MPISQNELDIEEFLRPDNVANEIALKWSQWDALRDQWKEEQKEIRNFLFATDTTYTTGKTLDWSNSTTIPKLTQIYDNLKANYEAALWPREEFLIWEGVNNREASKEVSKVAKGYVKTKLSQQNFVTKVADSLLDDYIMYGNCFATIEWKDEGHIHNEGTPLEEWISGYVGPKIVRVSPFDIVFNPTAATFNDTPKIIRSLVSLGSLKKMNLPDGIWEKIMTNRGRINGFEGNTERSEAYVADGFSDIKHYYTSGYVEILTFYGDMYNHEDNELIENRRIVVIDRAYIISDEPIASWLGDTPVFHAGWRNRPDNLYGMSPLANLVGMQYRIDHLENLKADVFDQIAYPKVLIKGQVEPFSNDPGEHIIMGDDGQVDYLAPDATALNADNQIQTLAVTMEEFAGAPRQAMGIRTPGEKTAFEVNVLEQNTGRLFQHKSYKLDREFFEPIYNTMLAAGRENLDRGDIIRVFDDMAQLEIFQSITRDQLASKGYIRAVGARHFAEKARRVQQLQSIIQLRAADPTIAAHMSGKKIAEILAEELGEPEMFEANVTVKEQFETQSAVQDAEVEQQEDLQIKAELGV